jgi:3-(3-hydroxy-phenyl)propionate hydroxylase
MPDAVQRFDVAIVGYGPVGALLANLLGQAGVSVVALEREAAIPVLPRAVHFDGEVMRIFQSAGLAEDVRAVARPSSKGMHFASADGKTLLVRRGSEAPGPHAWASNWYFHQPLLEEALRKGAERFPNVAVRLRHDVFAIDERDDAVTLRVEDMATGTLHRYAARYVVGADGARSLVRRLIGGTMEDLGLHQPWLVVDVLADPESPRVKALPDYTIQHCDPARPMTAVYVGGNRRRWEIMLMPGEDPAQLARPQRFWPLLERWLRPEDGVLERSAVYTFHSVIARGWRRGRLLLAGDSCHQTPPFLGQGLCAGARDAANLAWKLAAVVRGQAKDALLDTYESERRPHVQAFIELAVRLGNMIQTTDPAVAAERDRQFAEGEPRIFDYPQPQLGPGARADAAPPVGVVFAQPMLADGRLLDDATGNRFAVIGARTVLAAASEASRARWRGAGAAIVDAPGEAIDTWLAAHRAAALILRPDRYVFGLARETSALDALSASLPY